ncbi:MAG: glycine cleavage system aminomethyltransferase GcvT [Thaumarchaeota archaeon]|nr:glycine cleavage system aminomethyltransferase GcvT [Nitrososphaerota archaeon]
MLRTTQLHDYHSKHGKLTEFAGYEMPLWYTTTTDEHLAVRNSSGIFDVSHMGRFLVKGDRSTDFLEGLVPTAVRSQPPGKAFYTLLLNDRGGIMDDLIIEKLEDDRYLVVVNAANAEADMRHMVAHAPQGLDVEDNTESTAMIAVQGPKAQSFLQGLTPLDLGQLKRFRCAETKVAGQDALVSRTGYTGEDGFEVIVYGTSNERPEGAASVWEKLAENSTPCGLGARDSLRLEAGYPLHGSDIDQGTNPFEADLAWVISAGKAGYVGSDALAEPGARTPSVVRRGLVLESGVPRHGFEVLDGSGSLGVVTSGTFSPIVRKGVALCKVRSDRTNLGAKVSVIVRASPQAGTIAKPPFYDEQLYGWKRQKGN